MSALRWSLDRITSGFMIVGTLSILLMSGHVCADIVYRAVFGRNMIGTVDIVSAYYMVGVIFLPLGFVTLHNEHINVEILTQKLRRPTRLKFSIMADIVSALMIGWLAYQSFLEAVSRTRRWESWEAGMHKIIVWPSRWVVAFAFAMVVLYFILSAIDRIREHRRAG